MKKYSGLLVPVLTVLVVVAALIALKLLVL